MESIIRYRGLPWSWGATDAEIDADYPCSGRVPGRVLAAHRAIDVSAPSKVVFRWLCQLKQGTYSYRMRGGGPRTLTPGADELAVGQSMMVFQIVDDHDSHITGEVLPQLRRKYGPMACSYMVRTTGAGTSRIVVRLEIGAPNPARRLVATALAWGDLVMMRKQLRTLKALAEATIPA